MGRLSVYSCLAVLEAVYRGGIRFRVQLLFAGLEDVSPPHTHPTGGLTLGQLVCLDAVWSLCGME